MIFLVLNRRHFPDRRFLEEDDQGIANKIGLHVIPRSEAARNLSLISNLKFQMESRSTIGYAPEGRETTQSSSPIMMAAASTVVHNPRLSPTADCVMFIVRTILLEIR